MSSDRLGKYRERPTRSRTPYTRPKGLIRRVTDSVSGLLGSSWIPGFLRPDEEEEQQQDEGGQRHRAATEQNHHTNHQEAGPSGYTRPAANPLQLSPRSLAAIYPEEAGGDDSALAVAGSSSQTANDGNNTIAVGSKNTYHTSTLAVTANTLQGQDPACNLGEINVSGLISESGFREKYRAERLAQQQQQQLFSTPHSTGNSHFGVSSTQTQAGNDTLQFSGAASSSAMPFSNENSQLFSAGTSLQFSFQQHQASQAELSRTVQLLQKQPDAGSPTARMPIRQQQHTPASALEADDSVSTPSSRLSSAQSASKRPRFSLAAYNAAATPVGNKSILSDGSFRSSPFYPGRTIYGGAAAYRRTPTPVTPNRSATASPHLGAPPGDAGLSQAAQRILTCLNAMSTPLADAKRIPTPSASPYASYLDSPYTAAFHKHRPNRPPTSALNTPAKVGIQSNLSQYVLPPRGSVNKLHPSAQSSGGNKADNDSFLDPAASSANSGGQQPSIFSVAAASASRSSASSGGGAALGSKPSSSSSATSQQSASKSNPLLQPRKPIGLDDHRTSGRQILELGTTSCSVNTSSSSLAVSRQPAAFSFGGASESSVSTGGGKIKSDKHRQKSSARLGDGRDEMVVPPALPNATLPKMDFTIPFALTDTRSKSSDAASTASSPPSSDDTKGSSIESRGRDCLDGFKFSVPEVVVNKKGGSTSGDKTTMQFKFSTPASVLSVESRSNNENFVVSDSSTTFVPKVKSISPVKKSSVVSTRELITKPGDLLDFLNKSSARGSGGKSVSVSKESSTDNITSSKGCESVGWGNKFKVSAGSWECSACLLRNKAEDSKCIACEAAKPGVSNTTTQLALVAGASSNIIIGANKDNGAKSGFGDLFKKSSGDWDCTICLLRNKGASENCVACQTLKPGSKSTSGETPSTNTFSLGVKSVPLSTTTSSNSSAFSFGLPSSSAVSSNNSTTSTTTTTGFSFGITPVSSSSFIGASSGSAASIFGGAVTSASSKVNSTASKTSSVSRDISADKLACQAVPSTADFGAAFKKASGDWECASCLLNNKSSAVKCVACETAKPGAAGNQAVSAGLPSSASAFTAGPMQGFGNKFKKAPGDWECEVCMVSNKAPSTKCLACESLKPGSAVDSSKVLTGNFSFGSSAKSNEGAFKFGVSSDAGCVPPSGKSTSSGAGFSFGVSTATPASTASLSTSKTALSIENGKPEFSFGVKSTTTTSNGSVSFGAYNTSTKSSDMQVASSSTANFSFAASSNHTPPKTKPTESSIKTTSVLSSGSVLDFLKNGSEKSKENSNTPKKEVTNFFFGGAAPLAPTSNQTNTIFGGSGNTAVQSNDSAAKPASILSSFNSLPTTAPAPGTATTNNTIAQPNKTSNKRTFDDTEDASLTCGKRNNSSFIKNNGIAEASSTFSFGKPSGGAPSSALPPMFQLGGATAAPKTIPAFGPTAFGGAPTSNFINNNTIGNDTSSSKAGATAPIFAFGQPPEKKPSASFDFGQAPPVPSFNFTQAAPTTFPFTQNNDGGGPGNNGLFQFGNAPASPANSVTPSFGASSNPFSQTPSGTPAGRVMKKAIRRTKK